MEIIAPTAEWLDKNRYEPPTTNQKTARRVYRRISQSEELKNRGDITDEQFRAAEKLLKHWLGSQGVKVQMEDGIIALNVDTEYPTTYHAQKVAEAQATVRSPRVWSALLHLVAETASLVDIGKAPGRTSHPTARAYALGQINAGLDHLVDLWGLAARRQPPP